MATQTSFETTGSSIVDVDGAIFAAADDVPVVKVEAGDDVVGVGGERGGGVVAGEPIATHDVVAGVELFKWVVGEWEKGRG